MDMGPSLLESRRAVMEARWTLQGTKCPCCDGMAKVYKRRLNSTIARALIWIVRKSGKEFAWVHVSKDAPRWIVASNQWSLLLHWGLIEAPPGDDAHLGMWRALPKGQDFVLERTTVPTHVLIYNNTFLGFTGPNFTIRDALGKRFLYSEIFETEDLHYFGALAPLGGSNG